MGPLGLITPYPGISYIFADDNTREMDASLLGIAYTGGTGSGFGGAPGSPPMWNPAWAEMVNKIDGKFKVKVSSFIVGGLTGPLENHHNAHEGIGYICSQCDQRRTRVARPLTTKRCRDRLYKRAVRFRGHSLSNIPPFSSGLFWIIARPVSLSCIVHNYRYDVLFELTPYGLSRFDGPLDIGTD
jgi:hypothetical protein